MSGDLFLVGLAAAPLIAHAAVRLTETVYVVAPNSPRDAAHLATVRDDMRRLGRPRLRAVREPRRKRIDGHPTWRLLEGSHRAHVALRARIPVQLVEVGADEIVDVDWSDPGGDPLPPAAAGVVAASWGEPVLLEFPWWQVQRVVRWRTRGCA